MEGENFGEFGDLQEIRRNFPVQNFYFNHMPQEYSVIPIDW